VIRIGRHSAPGAVSGSLRIPLVSKRGGVIAHPQKGGAIRGGNRPLRMKWTYLKIRVDPNASLRCSNLLIQMNERNVDTTVDAARLEVCATRHCGKRDLARSIYAPLEFFESCFRILAIASWEGGQFVSHVLQWNTSAPDFSSASNSSRLNVTVWLWSFG